MTCSRAFKWAVALLVTLTLGYKILVTSLVVSEPPEPSTDSPEQVMARPTAAFLVRNHFNIIRNERIIFGLEIIEAGAGACRMRIALSSSRGWHRDLISSFTTPEDRTFVVFKGQIYPEQPMWVTVTDFLWSRFLVELGLRRYPNPVVNVIAPPICEAERLPWQELE